MAPLSRPLTFERAHIGDVVVRAAAAVRGQRHRRRRRAGVERDAIGRGCRSVAGGVGELGGDRLRSVGAQIPRGHRQAHVAGGNVARRDGVRHVMRQRRAAQQQLHRVAHRNRRIERHLEGRVGHLGDIVAARGARIRPRRQCRRAAARRRRIEGEGEGGGSRDVAGEIGLPHLDGVGPLRQLGQRSGRWCSSCCRRRASTRPSPRSPCPSAPARGRW